MTTAVEALEEIRTIEVRSGHLDDLQYRNEVGDILSRVQQPQQHGDVERLRMETKEKLEKVFSLAMVRPEHGSIGKRWLDEAHAAIDRLADARAAVSHTNKPSEKVLPAVDSEAGVIGDAPAQPWLADRHRNQDAPLGQGASEKVREALHSLKEITECECGGLCPACIQRLCEKGIDVIESALSEPAPTEDSCKD